MKSAVIVLLAVAAMANAYPQGVQVAELPDQVRVVEQPGQQPNLIQPVDPGFYRPSNPPGGSGGLIVDPGFSRPSAPGGSGVAVDPGFYQPSVDQAIYQPTGNRPAKQYDHPWLRGGK